MPFLDPYDAVSGTLKWHSLPGLPGTNCATTLPLSRGCTGERSCNDVEPPPDLVSPRHMEQFQNERDRVDNTSNETSTIYETVVRVEAYLLRVFRISIRIQTATSQFLTMMMVVGSLAVLPEYVFDIGPLILYLSSLVFVSI